MQEAMMSIQVLEQTGGSVLRYGERVGRELLNLCVPRALKRDGWAVILAV